LVSSWNQLSPGEREVLALVAFEGLDAKSLAKSLGTTVNGATIRLSRARKKLSNLMKEFDQR
jgi:RNA polymerase sigma-70 factor (ECF subfamily)